jgi:tetratricopeptide (TPR) repeat protein
MEKSGSFSELIWGRSAINLSVALTEIVNINKIENGESDPGIFKEVIELCEKTAELFPKSTAGYEWAIARKNMGMAFLRINNPGDEKKAEELFLDALTVFSDSKYPAKRIDTLMLLSEIYMRQKKWDQAVDLFEEIQLLDLAIREQNVSYIAEENRIRITSVIFSWAAYALAQSGDPKKAVQWLEAGKMQLLRNYMNIEKKLGTLSGKSPGTDDIYTARQTHALTVKQTGNSQQIEDVSEKIQQIRHLKQKMNSVFRHIDPQDNLRSSLTDSILDQYKIKIVCFYIVTSFGSAVVILDGTQSHY